MTAEPAIISIDLEKNWFHLIGLNEKGTTVLRRKLNRTQLSEFVDAENGLSPRTVTLLHRLRQRWLGGGGCRRRSHV